MAQREALTNGRFVNLDGKDSSFFKVQDLVTEGESKLFRLDLTGDIDARERPIEDGDGPVSIPFMERLVMLWA